MPDKDQTRGEAQGLLGCADTKKGKVNALDFVTSDMHGVCISNGKGTLYISSIVVSH